MKRQNDIYKCEVCGSMVETIDERSRNLKCCDTLMVKLIENTAGEDETMHIPMLRKIDRVQSVYGATGGFDPSSGGVTFGSRRIKTGESLLISIGRYYHPMVENHYIEYIEVLFDDTIYKKFFSPGEKPEAEILLEKDKRYSLEVRAYCNIHGLWKTKRHNL